MSEPIIRVELNPELESYGYEKGGLHINPLLNEYFKTDRIKTTEKTIESKYSLNNSLCDING